MTWLFLGPPYAPWVRRLQEKPVLIFLYRIGQILKRQAGAARRESSFLQRHLHTLLIVPRGSPTMLQIFRPHRLRLLSHPHKAPRPLSVSNQAQNHPTLPQSAACLICIHFVLKEPPLKESQLAATGTEFAPTKLHLAQVVT